MNDLANSMQVVQTHQTLLGHDAYERHRHTFVIVAFDHFEQVHAQNLEHHYEMFPVWPVMQEAVQQLDTVAVIASDIV